MTVGSWLQISTLEASLVKMHLLTSALKNRLIVVPNRSSDTSELELKARCVSQNNSYSQKFYRNHCLLRNVWYLAVSCVVAYLPCGISSINGAEI